jgi:hypothetical protein
VFLSDPSVIPPDTLTINVPIGLGLTIPVPLDLTLLHGLIGVSEQNAGVDISPVPSVVGVLASSDVETSGGPLPVSGGNVPDVANTLVLLGIILSALVYARRSSRQGRQRRQRIVGHG